MSLNHMIYEQGVMQDLGSPQRPQPQLSPQHSQPQQQSPPSSSKFEHRV